MSEPIAIDFADPTRAKRLPRHGWSKNSQGVKLLWLPVLRLVHKADEIRKANGLPELLSWGQQSEIRAFYLVTMRFCLTLRELAKCIRLGSDPYFDTDDDAKRNKSYEASSLIPLFLDLAFVYARRLADHFAKASRYVLFKHHGSANREFKNLRKTVTEPAKLQRLEPFCEASILQEAFERHSGWFDKLRNSKDENEKDQKGIRDIMEHHPVVVHAQQIKVGDGPWEVMAYLGEPGINSSFRPDLIPILKEVVADMAALWTLVCDSARLPPAKQLSVAPIGDAVLLTDERTVHPEVTGRHYPI